MQGLLAIFDKNFMLRCFGRQCITFTDARASGAGLLGLGLLFIFFSLRRES
jgi:hypothetical protein